jgi:beta-carotene 3-hydroxylase
MISKILALIVGFAGMEWMAHLMYKYVMHGFLWSLHQSHHQKGKGFFEKNDLYFLIFASPSIVLIIAGANSGFNWLFFLGLGIALYGFTYLFIHDIVIHQRVRWFTKSDNRYIRALRSAHKAHHANTHKDAAVSYGMLWVDAKYFPPKTISDKFSGHNILF